MTKHKGEKRAIRDRMVKTGEPESTQLDFVFRFPGGERPVLIVMAYVAAIGRGLLLIDPR